MNLTPEETWIMLIAGMIVGILLLAIPASRDMRKKNLPPTEEKK